MHPVARSLISWYRKNGRDLPWRNTRDPYKIWLSEVILQQTRVEQGLPYYERFVEAFPDVLSLAKSKEEKVLKLWQGLGYYSRGRNLHKAAQVIVKAHHGVFPSDYADIRSLPGVGDYTAAAIASFAFKLSHPVVDGNVYRFLSRYFGIKTPIDSTQGKKVFAAVAHELIAGAAPDEFNQAIMEFGALHCTPKQPGCATCIFATQCTARADDTVNSLPVKNKKTVVRERYFHYLVIREGNSLYLQQRTGKDIWKNLWEFPLIESGSLLSEKKLLQLCNGIFDTGNVVLKSTITTHRHLLSHQTIHASFYEFDVTEKIHVPKAWKKVGSKSFEKHPVPRLIERYLNGN